MGFEQIFYGWLCVLVILCHRSAAQSCSDNNGGCSHQCLDRNDGGSLQCTCPCNFQLTSSSKTCEAVVSCQQDVYILIDASSHIDESDCAQSQDPNVTKSWTNWLKWKTDAVAVMNYFADDDPTSATNVGVQLYSGSNLDTRANYDTSPTLAEAIADLITSPEPLCNGTSTFIKHLETAIDENPSVSNWVYQGPSSLRSFEDTTRVAIVLVFAPGTALSDNEILQRMEQIHKRFDVVIVITRTISNETQSLANENLVRLAACGQTTDSCPYLFYVDKVNDYNVPLCEYSIRNVIDPGSCRAREQQKFSATFFNGKITFTIPTCLLQGLGTDDLAVIDPTCDLSQYASTSGDNLVISLPYSACGTIEEVSDPSTLDSLTTLIQRVATRPFPNGSSVPNVQFNATLTFPTYLKESLIAVIPQNVVVQQSISQSASIPLNMQIYSDETFVAPVMDSPTVVVGSTVYVEATSPIEGPLSLVLNKCFATPSSSPTDPIQYVLAENGCNADETFVIHSPTSLASVKFQFDMFEFTSGFDSENADKPQVYVHCVFYVCIITDTSQRCKPDCSSRRKRSVGTNSENIKHALHQTIGPFYVAEKEDEVHELQVSKDSESWDDYSNTGDSALQDEDVINYSELNQRSWEAPRRIQLVMPTLNSLSLLSIISHITFLALACFVAMLIVRSLKSRPAAINNLSSRGTIPYHHCAKSEIDREHCFANDNCLVPECGTCYHQPISLLNNTLATKESKLPPEYKP